ncbi:hypothetical protein [Actinophytocola glycyrrhizae]|uniref:Uncharacterized protein n=1 Tax=Actinophytocola glycyrrhizae TaxID=2044873 RepID=A0ABV9SFA4_9PSEU
MGKPEFAANLIGSPAASNAGDRLCSGRPSQLPHVRDLLARLKAAIMAGRSLPTAMQDRLITEADALTPDKPYDVHILDTSHVGFLYRAPEVAAILARGDRAAPEARPRR